MSLHRLIPGAQILASFNVVSLLVMPKKLRYNVKIDYISFNNQNKFDIDLRY
jgi:hypoxanthine-guanine phosphoribosyltransferase